VPAESLADWRVHEEVGREKLEPLPSQPLSRLESAVLDQLLALVELQGVPVVMAAKTTDMMLCARQLPGCSS
jgi:hypothetical protein